MDSKITLRLFFLIFFFTATHLNAIEFKGKFLQGHYIIGLTDPKAEIIIDKKKVKLIKLPVHSKNPLIILFNSIILIFLIVFFKISVVHVRSRAPAWSCFSATKITNCKYVTTFHGTYNFKSDIKKF